MNKGEPKVRGKGDGTTNSGSFSKYDFVPGLYAALTAGIIATVVAGLTWMTDGRPPWRVNEPPMIIALRNTFEAISEEAGLPIDRGKCRAISKYLANGKYLMNYTCPVPETARPALRAALVTRSWEPEANLNDRMFGLRKDNQVASLYCRFGEKFCDLQVEQVPKL